jgi:hypothetical protein
VLTIPVTSLTEIPEGPITLSVSVTNIFGVQFTAQHRFNKKNSTQAPLFVLDKSQTDFRPADGFRLSAKPKASQCRSARTVWTWSTDIPEVTLQATSSGSSVALNAYDLIGNVEVGAQYNVTLRASYEGSDAVNEDTVTLTAVGSPLVVQLIGPSGTVSMNSTLTFDASGSFDPDDPESLSSQLSYLWKCQNQADRSFCFGSWIDGVLTLDPAKVRSCIHP